jgi:transposase
MSQPYYDRDLTAEEWQQIGLLLPPEKPVGKEQEVDLRVVLNGIFYRYRADNGIKWRALLSDISRLANGIWVFPFVGATRNLGAN